MSHEVVVELYFRACCWLVVFITRVEERTVFDVRIPESMGKRKKLKALYVDIWSKHNLRPSDNISHPDLRFFVLLMAQP